MKVCLKVPLSEAECARRNALSEKSPRFVLRRGMVGILVDVFDNGESLMVEFRQEGSGQCQWLGVLRASEVEFITTVARAA